MGSEKPPYVTLNSQISHYSDNVTPTGNIKSIVTNQNDFHLSNMNLRPQYQIERGGSKRQKSTKQFTALARDDELGKSRRSFFQQFQNEDMTTLKMPKIKLHNQELSMEKKSNSLINKAEVVRKQLLDSHLTDINQENCKSRSYSKIQSKDNIRRSVVIMKQSQV